MKASLIFSQTFKIPLYLRVWFNNGKAESRLSFDLTAGRVDVWNAMSTRLQERNAPVNYYLSRIESSFHDFLIANATNLNDYSPAEIRDAVLGLKKQSDQTVIVFVDAYFESTVLNNPNVAPGTINVYRRSINHLKAFHEYRNQSKLAIEKIDYEFASEFKNFFVCKNERLDRAGMKEVSAAGVINSCCEFFSCLESLILYGHQE